MELKGRFPYLGRSIQMISSIAKNAILALILNLLGLVSLDARAQRYEYVYRNTADSSFNCYLKIFPVSDSIRGLVIRDFTELPDMTQSSAYKFTQMCSENGLLTLITNTSRAFPEFFSSDSTMFLLDTILKEVLAEHHIPKNNIFIGGMSASGTRALRFAEYCAQGKSELKIKGVFAVDAPLDLARFYMSAYSNAHYFKSGMKTEATMVIPLFEELFGGSPTQFPDRYRDASVFTHRDSSGGNAYLLRNTDLILFHEPDIDWWLHERGAGYYDINSYDLVAFSRYLMDAGNESIKLITSAGKGYNKEGVRNCHSWSIVDESLLMNWINDRME